MIRTSMRVGAIVALAACLGVSGCQSKPKNDLVINVGPDGRMTVQSSGSPEDRALAALLQLALDKEAAKDEKAPLTEAQIWRKDDDGNITHIQSGATCPVTWAGLTRDKLSVFAADGTDVGCNFVTPNAGPTYMTFYVYQRAGGMEEAMKEAVDGMKARQPVAKETPYFAPSSNGQYRSLTLSYKAADGTPMRTSVLLAQSGGWLLKMRLTCREDDARVAEQSAALGLMGQADRLRSPQPLPPPVPPAKPI
jgi:hypothetical protein